MGNKNLDEKCKTCIFYKMCDAFNLDHCEGDAYYKDNLEEGEQ